MDYLKWINEANEEQDMCPPEMDAQMAVDFLAYYLLEPRQYNETDITRNQLNTKIVEDIIFQYSEKYKNEWKEAGFEDE